MRERQTTRAVPLVKGRLSGFLTAPLVFLVSPASRQRVADRVIRVCMAQITRAKPTTSAGKSQLSSKPSLPSLRNNKWIAITLIGSHRCPAISARRRSTHGWVAGRPCLKRLICLLTRIGRIARFSGITMALSLAFGVWLLGVMRTNDDFL